MFDLIGLIKTAGYLGIGGIVFAESGLFFGLFLPGDSLLFTAGFLASQGYLNIFILILLTFVCAVAGDSVGYWFGHKIGPGIFNKDDSWFFHKDNLVRTEKFFAAHGKKAIILARFLPVVRTFTPIMAGVGRMNYSLFFAYNVIGAAFWTFGLALGGYYLGKLVPNVDKYIIPIIIAIIILSTLPTVAHLTRDWYNRRQINKNK